jgi:hypothetical protein
VSFARNKPRLGRVGVDAANNRTLVDIVANKAIVVVRVLDGTFSLKAIVDGLGNKRLPKVQKAAQGELVERFDEHMNMVGHYTPYEEAIALAVEIQPCFFDN